MAYIFLILAATCLRFGYADIIPVSDAQKQEILNSHNEWRKNAGATAMLRLKWNDQLAQFAEKAAAKCAFDHTTWEQRQNIGGHSYIGENIYVYSAKTTFKDAIDSWGSEIKDYDLNSDTCRGVCGHYTQITWAKTSEVGCAMVQCGNVAKFNSPGYLVFCNYGIGGNMQGEKPFEKGSPGSKCQAEFKTAAGSDGLCGEGGSNNGKNNGDVDANDNEGNTDDNGNDNGDNSGDNTGDDNGDNGDNNGDNGDNGDNTGDNNGDNNGDNGNQDSGDCKDEIWYCHDWLQACGKEEWTERACRKSCKLC